LETRDSLRVFGCEGSAYSTSKYVLIAIAAGDGWNAREN
jgi:hypothetical protein